MNSRFVLPALAALAALALLAGCDRKEATAPKGSSFGQVLPGSASDAMLPYDTATSAPPLEAPDDALLQGGSAPRAIGSERAGPGGEADVVPSVEAT